MSRYHLTNQARADLHDIFVYGFGQFGERQADAYAAGLDHVFMLLAENPQMGRKAKAIAPSVRRRSDPCHYPWTQRPTELVLSGSGPPDTSGQKIRLEAW